ncbi:T. brucei spp.-specific protein [Trypanosoma brucei gambiense DAL972]|uniref:T. brucei spp.-specific protein n=1 Tax=Trypanosoma brucei gambiense (strain MHOM/CI/86/DAL972) TaxID=679716 RepID=C9ZYS5_TRYB9|nr:T. brucei spp.-specific protein [Trypanosoma brucei gambiense DAL972]CBH14574.1 T. brucei spp.-specific protein [Trypanosoma brucei gambiense DAL972]|eukprot:XP_011776840.1 T. brucei spp.-specific protein [Trypanosoma brucei gambiense DAL972]
MEYRLVERKEENKKKKRQKIKIKIKEARRVGGICVAFLQRGRGGANINVYIFFASFCVCVCVCIWNVGNATQTLVMPFRKQVTFFLFNLILSFFFLFQLHHIVPQGGFFFFELWGSYFLKVKSQSPGCLRCELLKVFLLVVPSISACCLQSPILYEEYRTASLRGTVEFTPRCFTVRCVQRV